jgi:hypothetical protein
MEKIELKYLAPYLPYGLRCHLNNGIVEVNGISGNLVSVKDPDSIEAGMYVGCEELKPILKPFSKLLEGDYMELCRRANSLPFDGANKHKWTANVSKQNYLTVSNKWNVYSFQIDLSNGDVTVYVEDELHTTDNMIAITQFYFEYNYDVFGLYQ